MAVEATTTEEKQTTLFEFKRFINIPWIDLKTIPSGVNQVQPIEPKIVSERARRAFVALLDPELKYAPIAQVHLEYDTNLNLLKLIWPGEEKPSHQDFDIVEIMYSRYLTTEPLQPICRILCKILFLYVFAKSYYNSFPYPHLEEKKIAMDLDKYQVPALVEKYFMEMKTISSTEYAAYITNFQIMFSNYGVDM